MEGLAFGVAFLRHFSAEHVAEVGLQERDDAEGVHHEVLRVFGVRGDAVNALLTEGDHGVRQNLHLSEDSERNHRFHHVQFKLAGGGGEHHRGVEADREEGGLVRYFRDHRIHLARHDGRARLAHRQVDFGKTRTGAGGEQTHIVADLRQLHGEALRGGRDRDIGAAVTRRGDQIVAVMEVDASLFSEVLHSLRRIVRVACR